MPLPEAPTARNERHQGGDAPDILESMHWTAQVVREDDKLQWKDFAVSRSDLTTNVFGINASTNTHELWNNVTAPDLDAMTAKSNNAILAGDSGYDQEYRVVRNGRLFWLGEHVQVSPTGIGAWELHGAVTDITSLREGKTAYATSEVDVQQILKVSDCLLWRAQVFKRREGVNPDWVLQIPPSNLYRKLFGGDPPARSMKLWDEHMVPDLPEMSARSNAAILGGAPDYEQDYRVLIGGKVLWMHEHVSVVAVGPGEWLLTGILMDVTSAHLTEEARKKSEAQLEQILAAADCLIWHAIVTQEQAGANKWDIIPTKSALYTKLFGEPVDTAERLVLRWEDLNVPELPEMKRRGQAALMCGLSSYEQEFSVIKAESTYWLREQVSIKYVSEKECDMVGVITDVSNKRKVEEALADERERLAVTLRAMTEGVITTDTDGYIQFINPAAVILTECDAASAAGRPITEVCTLQHPGQGTSVLSQMTSQGDRVAELPPGTSLITKKGPRTVEGCCAPIHSAKSKVIGIVLVFRDVTERGRLEQELVRASRLESVGILAGGIAHDFNNILTAVIGYLSLAKLDIDGDSEAGRCLREAESASLRARDLTQQLLTFSNGGEPVRMAVDFSTIVREVADFGIHGSAVKNVFDLPEDLWPIDADKGQIGRVVQNMVINAVQAMPEGGTIRIAASNEQVTGYTGPALDPGDYVHISVEDTGTGIKPDNLAHIFDPYFTTKASGSGLGLAAVYSIIKKHRGLITVESAIGQGTTFHIWLPALRATSTEETRDAPGTLTQLKGRVLLMDDEPTIRHMAAILMRRVGLDVVTVCDGREAVAHFEVAHREGNPFALVIMDLTVPGGMGGKEAIGYLKEIDRNVKVVVSSGYSSDPILANYKEYGFCGVITKPYDVATFNRVIAGSLERAVA